MSRLTVSVVIVSYNSREDLEACLPTLQRQNVDCEIIVVDNCSTDGTPEWLQSEHPDIRLVRTDFNAGYAQANNIGVEFASGDFIFILNPDTELVAGALDELIRIARENPTAIVTPKLLQENGTVNACGNKMHFTGIATCNGVGESPSTYTGVFPVLLLSGAAFICSREQWHRIGGFDPNYFMYVEDVDFSLRARLVGYDILCAADVQVLHKWDLRLSAQKFFYLQRNRLWTIYKVYEGKTILPLCFSLFMTECAIWAFALLKGPAFLAAHIRAYRSLWKSRDTLRNSRALVQKQRIVGDRDLLAMMLPSLPFDAMVSPIMARILGRLTTPIFQVFHRWGVRT